ncbi:MAG: hypothetical protein JJE25_01920 [Bacteroidia bacterium]|nr:hypothetical protein [Bacteroidia bacterium]
MKKFTSTISIFLFSFYYSFAGNENVAAGARSTGVSGASVCYSDLWSAFQNQAGLADVKKISGGIYFENRFNLTELSVKGFVFALPASESGTFALSGTYFGYSLYNEKKIGVAFGKSFGSKLKAGVQLDYLSTFIAEGYGTRTAFTGEAGILAEPVKNLLLGFHIYNPTQTKIADYSDERIPVIMRIGAAYKFSEKVIVSIENEKQVDADGIFKTGIEYRIAEPLFLRGGISTNPSQNSFGFGLKFGHFIFDAAASFHETLGFTPHISLQYAMK